ncbi:hybrid sensor histidine kinase/response regulator [Methylocystis bryophila]|nr:PAS domain-containing protein [Methylocystis bryophila]BDV39811.1 hypothetical protein DSM21852_30640 [Methylocystis bryophila]
MTMFPNEPSFFKALADGSPLFILMCDLSFRPFYVNAAGRRLVGLDDHRRFVETPVQALFFPEDQDFILNEFLPRVLREGRAETETRFRRLDTGEAIWMIHDAFLLFDSEGEPVGLATQSRDITERKRSQQALQQKTMLLQGIIESMPDPIFAKDVECRMLMANSATLETIGKSAAEVLGRSEAEWRHDPQEVARIQANDRRIMNGGQAETFEEAFTTPGKPARIFRATKSPLRDAAGAVVGVVGVARDVTALKEAEAALRASEERLRALLTASSETIYSMSPDWKKIRLQGRDLLEEAETEEWLEKYIPDEDRAMVLGVIAEAIRTKSIFQLEHRVRLADGEIGWTSSRAVPILNEQGEISEWFGAASDITIRKRSETALRDADMRKNEFIATLAHELRNPLAPIHNAALVLQRRRAPDDPDSVLVDMIQRQTDHLVRLVDDLLVISRIRYGKIELRKEKTDMVAIVRDALMSCRPLIEKKTHRVKTKVASAPLWVFGDAVRLTQIAVNLIDNAVKYTPPDGLIEIEAALEADEIVFRVRDNGVGLAAETLSQVFELFMQVRDGADSPQGGLGIGLALARKLVELHGGRIEAHSPGPRCGSEFVVRLPQWDGPTTQSSENMRAAAPKRSDADRWARVLVIDDDRETCGSFSFLLESLGTIVRVARDGHSGIAAIDDFRPDAIFCDIGMSGLDGYETARRIRAAHGHELLLIALTGWGRTEDRRRARQAGFDAHLTKPASIDAVEAVLSRISPVPPPKLIADGLLRAPYSG